MTSTERAAELKISVSNVLIDLDQQLDEAILQSDVQLIRKICYIYDCLVTSVFDSRDEAEEAGFYYPENATTHRIRQVTRYMHYVDPDEM